MNRQVPYRLARPKNMYSYVIHSNPITSFNSMESFPMVNKCSFIGPFTSIIGDVRICKDVFVGCNVTLRADEGSPFFIGSRSNIQDGVIFHGVKNAPIIFNNMKYSIYVGTDVSIAHGALIHGSSFIGNKAFIGFNASVINATIGDGSYVDNRATVTGGVRVPDNRYVPKGAIIDTQARADALRPVTEDERSFAMDVVNTNLELVRAYMLKIGENPCICYNCCE